MAFTEEPTATGFNVGDTVGSLNTTDDRRILNRSVAGEVIISASFETDDDDFDVSLSALG